MRTATAPTTSSALAARVCRRAGPVLALNLFTPSRPLLDIGSHAVVKDAGSPAACCVRSFSRPPGTVLDQMLNSLTPGMVQYTRHTGTSFTPAEVETQKRMPGTR